MTRFFLTGAVAGLILTSCAKPAPEPPRIRPVRWAVVGQDSTAATRSFPAVVQASQQSTLAFRVAGSLKGLRVKNGTKVTPGMVIAELEQVDHTNRVEQATAQLRSARSQLDIARPGYQRAERLYQSNTVSLADYQAAKGAYQAAQAQLQATSKQLEAARNQLAYTTLKAPYAGVVSAVHVDLGELVGAGTPVVTISSGDALEVQVELPESLINSVQVGAKLSIRCAATGDAPVPAVVSEVGFTAGKAGAFPVTARITDPPAELRPGMAANVRLPVDQGAQVLRVPMAAVAEDGSKTYVYRLEESGKARYLVRKQSVELGGLSGAGFELIDGLAAGDRVVTAGLGSLFDGLQVRLLDPAP